MGGLGTKDIVTTKQRAAHRIRIARGQLDSVLKMIENDEYCVNIIHQTRSIQNALREVDFLLLENHLKTCVVDLVKSGKSNQSAEEIIRLFRNNS